MLTVEQKMKLKKIQQKHKSSGGKSSDKLAACKKQIATLESGSKKLMASITSLKSNSNGGSIDNALNDGEKVSKSPIGLTRHFLTSKHRRSLND